MKMEECHNQLKCDFYGCKNMAKYAFSTKGFIRRELVFCEDCMKKMHECISKVIVPKSVEAPYKRNKKERT